MTAHQSNRSLPARLRGRPSRPGAAGRAVLLLALLLGLGACGTPRPPELPITLRWPEPPQVTRVEYVEIISSARDVTGPPGFWERFARFIGLTKGPRGRRIVHPVDIAVTPDAAIVYVSDFAQGVVHVFDRVLHKTRYFGAGKPLSRPSGLTLDSQGNLYVVEQGAPQIRVISPAGSTLRVIQSDKLIRPVGVAIDEAHGRLYVADPSHQNSQEHFVRVFDLDGNYLGEVGEGRGTDEGYLLFPTYLALDEAGNLYVADTMNSRISVFDPEGGFLRVIGARGDGFGLFDKPKGVALDSLGNVYVVDSSWSNVQIFGPEGHVLLYFGGRGGYPGLLRNPTGIAIAKTTNTIFVNDYLNRRLCIYQLVNTRPGEGLPTAGAAAPEPPGSDEDVTTGSNAQETTP